MTRLQQDHSISLQIKECGQVMNQDTFIWLSQTIKINQTISQRKKKKPLNLKLTWISQCWVWLFHRHDHLWLEQQYTLLLRGQHPNGKWFQQNQENQWNSPECSGCWRSSSSWMRPYRFVQSGTAGSLPGIFRRLRLPAGQLSFPKAHLCKTMDGLQPGVNRPGVAAISHANTAFIWAQILTQWKS